MSINLPRDVVLPVDTVDVRLDPGQHPFERGREAAIGDNWKREVDINPRLYNGTMVLISDLSYSDQRLVGRCHAVPYATFLYWRRNLDTGNAGHMYAHAVLVASDGPLVAIRMAPHTVNAGRIYFAAGSFEPMDFREGLVDVEFNMRREVGEETGLDLAEAERGLRYHVLSTQRGTVVFRRYHMPYSANEMVARIRAFVAAEAEPEIDGPVVIHSATDLPDDLLPHMKPLIEWHFSGAE